MATGKEIAVIDPAAYAVMDDDFGDMGEALRENLAGADFNLFDLDRVTVPSAGTTTWTVSTLEGEKEEKFLEGIIVYWRDGRSYWPEAFSGEGTPPACFSPDSITGIGDPGGPCHHCPFAQFGSAGKGTQAQACKQTRSLLILGARSTLPFLVTVPPSSLKAVKQYFMQLAGQSLRYYGVVTRLSLVKTKNANGIAYSQIVPALASRLTTEQMARVHAYHLQLKPAIEGAVHAPEPRTTERWSNKTARNAPVSPDEIEWPDELPVADAPPAEAVQPSFADRLKV